MKKFLFLSLLLISLFTGCKSTSRNQKILTDSSVIEQIKTRGTLLIATTGDYRPLSYKEDNGEYWGYGIDVARLFAEKLGVKIEFVQTSWPTLTEDTLATPQKFDFAIGGITITEKRKETMLMSDGYLSNGKTILCRVSDAQKFNSL